MSTDVREATLAVEATVTVEEALIVEATVTVEATVVTRVDALPSVTTQKKMSEKWKKILCCCYSSLDKTALTCCNNTGNIDKDGEIGIVGIRLHQSGHHCCSVWN